MYSESEKENNVLKKFWLLFWKPKSNGHHQLLPTTESPVISTSTTLTNLSDLAARSNPAINTMTETDLARIFRRTISAKEPLEHTKPEKNQKFYQQPLGSSGEQLCSSGEKPNTFSLGRQIITSVAVSLVSMVIGYCSGYTSPAALSLMKDIEISNFHFSWISGSMPLAAVFGGIIGGPLIKKFGRKWIIVLSNFSFLIGWILICSAKDLSILYASRIISGCAMGIASLTLPVYLGEIIQPELRGTLGLLPTVFGNSGILLCFLMGVGFKWQGIALAGVLITKWRGIALVGGLITVPFFFLICFIPETPRWRNSKRKLPLPNAVEAEDLLTPEPEETRKTRKSICDLFKTSNLKPLMIVLGLMFFQQMSGINAIIFYTTQIFEDSKSDIPADIQTIIVGVVNLISTLIATLLIDRLGRKILLFISSVGMIIPLFILGGYFYLIQINSDLIEFYNWVPLASFIVYVLGFSLGFGPIPWLMMGEILPVKIRESAASVCTAFNWIFTFLVTTSFHLIKDIIGAHGVFWVFCAMVVLGLVFTIVVVPETKGQSLEDIERKLAGDTLNKTSLPVEV